MYCAGLSLAGEAMAHAIVPGIGIAFIFCGLSMFAIIVSGLITGVSVTLLTTFLARATIL
ncbi:MAG: hypothetical protein TECD_00296 [Hyphomicrobiaceae bacterium hypho_1]